jgi:hypothetical protein
MTSITQFFLFMAVCSFRVWPSLRGAASCARLHCYSNENTRRVCVSSGVINGTGRVPTEGHGVTSS